MGTYRVRIRLDCERYDFILRRRVLDVLDAIELNSIEECIRFIDESLKSEEFVSKYFGCKLKLEILEDYDVVEFIAITIGWDKDVSFLFSSNESILPLKEEYYHKAQQNSIWAAPEW